MSDDRVWFHQDGIGSARQKLSLQTQLLFCFSSANVHSTWTRVVHANVLCLSLHSSDSEGTFGTPEAESPPGVEKILAKLDNSNHTGEKVQVSDSPSDCSFFMEAISYSKLIF